MGVAACGAIAFRAVEVSNPISRLDLAAENIGTVLVAAGSRPYHPWLRLPVLARDGWIRQQRGVNSVPGLNVVGRPVSIAATRYSSTAHGTPQDMWSAICWVERHRRVTLRRIDGWLHDPA